jgi:hypothetical protein
MARSKWSVTEYLESKMSKIDLYNKKLIKNRFCIKKLVQNRLYPLKIMQNSFFQEAGTSRSTRRNHATPPHPSSNSNPARPTDSALVRMGMEPSLCEANTSAWPSKSSTNEMVNRIAELAVQGWEREETEANVALRSGGRAIKQSSNLTKYIKKSEKSIKT